MKILLAGVLSFATLVSGPLSAAEPDNRLPDAAVEALRSATRAEIYSLEPSIDPEDTSTPVVGTFHDYAVLGKATLEAAASRTAAAEFEAVVAGWDGMVALCFEPRHGLRVESKGHTYDFVLCFDCQSMRVYLDDEPLNSFGASGSAEVLNRLMADAGLELSQTGDKPPTAEEVAKDEADMARWLAAMPTSARPLWDTTERFHAGLGLKEPELGGLRESLEGEIPDAEARIRALFRWLGSGVGPWTGFPGWESVPEVLLLGYSTTDLLAAVAMDELDAAQREGVARLFSGWAFRHARPQDASQLSAALKRALLDHTLTTGDPQDEDRHARARSAFEDS